MEATGKSINAFPKKYVYTCGFLLFLVLIQSIGKISIKLVSLHPGLLIFTRQSRINDRIMIVVVFSTIGIKNLMLRSTNGF
jgi:hypothetical protein